MKRIIASAGLVALGVAGAQAAAVATAPADKPWSVSASLRGFYDSNYAQAPSNAEDSFGFEVNPTVGIQLNGQQTSFGAQYSYTLRYFDNRSDDTDSTHEFSAWLDHQFSERYSVDMRDTLVYSQEPSLTDPGTSTVIRSDGDVLRNEGAINFHAQLTRLFGIVTGYRNVLYSYDDQGYQDLLNRLEHYANIDFTWQVSPQTVALVGYQFGLIDYTSNDDTTFIDKTGATVVGPADTRNSRSHYFYVGMNRHFTPKLTCSFKVGAQYIEYYNLPSNSGLNDSDWGPYVQNSLRYDFLPGSYVEFGVIHQRTQTDINSATDGDSTTAYTTLSHSFTPKLIGTVTGLAQYTEYDNTFGTDTYDWLYEIGLDLTYHFTPHFSGNVAYNYDKVASDIPDRGFDRSRVFLGVTASY